jgi:UrcA family protein
MSKIKMHCLTTLTLCILSAAAVADTLPTRTVGYADLNLDTPAGVTALYRRIERAADKVCVAPRDTLLSQAEPFLKSCKAKAIAAAVYQVDVPALTTVHRMKSGRSGETVRVADGK